MSNCWWEITVVCDPTFEESISWRLDQFGCSGTVIQIGKDALEQEPLDQWQLEQALLNQKQANSSIKAYISDLKCTAKDLDSLNSSIQTDASSQGIGSPQVSWQLIEEEDWASGWKDYWQPQELGDRFLIYPAWWEVPQSTERLLMRLDPGAAFGTGTHPTTQLCLESLEKYLPSRKEAVDLAIADIGCGSGILSLGAMLLGVEEIIAVDNDPLATKTFRSNLQLNQVNPDHVVIQEGSIAEIAALPTKYDGVVCNILAKIIVQLFPHFNQITKKDSWAILSGILIEKQAEQIIELATEHGWQLESKQERQDWCCLNLRRH